MSAHVPVMLDEVLSNLSPQSEHTYVDGTFGGGGYTKAILQKAPCFVKGLDRDPDAMDRTAHIPKDRFHFIHDKLSNLHNYIPQDYDGLILDLGVSSFQIDQAERGFSFRFDGPLDMRMSKEGITAEEIVNTFPENKLADIIWEYGEERHARQIASLIVSQRKIKPLLTTKDLADLVLKVVKRVKDIHPATKTFQALRVFVNDELFEIYSCLKNAYHAKKIIIVSFQGLEVRAIKQWYHEQKIFTETRKIKPTREEILRNPRSRSAEMRVFERL
jgi:16S rRNA (cytosine1402-N4)-methyltransferase